MPSKTKKQAKFMAAVANNPKFAKKAGVPQSVGRDFAKADKGKTFKEGGMPGMKRDKRVLRNLDDEIYRIAPKERMGGAEGRDARQERLRINKEKRFEKNKMNGMMMGGKVKGYKKGGMAAKSCDGMAQQGLTRAPRQSGTRT